jgi:hypothetical protein
MYQQNSEQQMPPLEQMQMLKGYGEH